MTEPNGNEAPPKTSVVDDFFSALFANNAPNNTPATNTEASEKINVDSTRPGTQQSQQQQAQQQQVTTQVNHNNDDNDDDDYYNYKNNTQNNHHDDDDADEGNDDDDDDDDASNDDQAGNRKRERVLDEFDEYNLLSSKRGRRGSREVHRNKNFNNRRRPKIEARDIIQDVNNNQLNESDVSKLLDRQILSKRDIDWSTVKPESRMLVRQLPKFINKQDVMDYFSKYGEVLEVVQKTPFGFVHFENPDACAQAVQIENGKPFKGIILELEICKRKPFFARAQELPQKQNQEEPRSIVGAANGRRNSNQRNHEVPFREPREPPRNRGNMRNKRDLSPPPPLYQQNQPPRRRGPPDHGRNNDYRPDYGRNQQDDYGRNNQNDYGRNQNTGYGGRGQQNDYGRNQQADYGRNNNNDYGRNNNNDYGRNNQNDYGRNQQQDNRGGYNSYRGNNDNGRFVPRYNDAPMNEGRGAYAPRYNDPPVNEGRGAYAPRYNDPPAREGRYVPRYNDPPVNENRYGSRYNDTNNDEASRYAPRYNDIKQSPTRNYAPAPAAIPVAVPASVVAATPLIPPRSGIDVPIVQIVAWDNVAYGFTDYIERVFSSNQIRASSITLPYSKNSREEIVKQMILEGVKAIVMIDRHNEAVSKIYLQVFAPVEHGQGVRYDEYDSITAIEAVSIIRRSHPVPTALPPQQAPVPVVPSVQPQQPPAMNMNTLASLYNMIQSKSNGVSPPVSNQPTIPQLLATLVNGLNAPAAAALVAAAAPPPQALLEQPNIAALLSTAASGNPAIAQLLSQMTAAQQPVTTSAAATTAATPALVGYSPSLSNNNTAEPSLGYPSNNNYGIQNESQQN